MSNLLLQTAVSAYARMTGVYKSYRRYGHPIAKMLETLLSAGIWGNERSLKYFDKLFGTQEYGLVFPKLIEYFEYTDRLPVSAKHILLLLLLLPMNFYFAVPKHLSTRKIMIVL